MRDAATAPRCKTREVRKPSTGGIPAAIARALKGFRYAVGDIAYVVGRFLASAGRVLIRIPVAAGLAAAQFWRSLSLIARRRLVAALGAAVLLLIVFSAVVPNLPCQFPGGDSCPPSEDAAELVPGDALAYLHANLDPDTDEYEQAADVAAKLPVIGGQVVSRAAALIPAPAGSALDFEDDVRPWFGGEAAVAVLPGAGVAPERVDLLEAADSDGAGEYAGSLAVGDPRTSEYEGVEVSTDRSGVATAQVEGFLVIGTEDGVRAIIATATGADEAPAPLADDETATEVRDQLPDQRFAEAWLSADGIETLIVRDRGLFGTLGPLVAPGASLGAAASLSAGDDGLELAVRSALDPDRAEQTSSFFAAFPSFEPELPDDLSDATLAYLGIGAPADTVAALLALASTQAPGIATGFQGLVDQLRRTADVDLEQGLLEALGDELAVTLEPAPGGGAATETAPAPAAAPYVLFAASGVDEGDAQDALASLGGSLTPEFGQDEVDGVQTNSVRVSPTVELTYAVFDGLAAVATDPAGVAQLIAGDGGLADDDLYERATEGFPDEVSLQLYLDLEQLVATGEAAGLAEDPVYATFAGDFRRLDALGLAVSDSDEVLATDARLLIGDAPDNAPSTTTGVAPAGD